MQMNKEVAKISKKNFESLCPFCKSRAIYQIGAHRANPQGSIWYSDYPEAEIGEWKCAVCFGSFILF
jgi:transposase-like protein